MVTTPLRSPAPAEPPPRRRRLSLRRRRGEPFAAGWLELGPGPLELHRPDPEGPAMFRPKRRWIELGTVVAAVVALATAGLVGGIATATRVHIQVEGIEDGAAITTFDAAALEVRFEFDSDEEAAEATLVVDGEVIEEPGVLGPFMVWRPPEPLAEGDHSIEVRVPRPVFGDSVHRWEFTVDGTPPALEVPTATDPVGIDEPAEVSGRVEEGAELTADGDPVEVDDEGRFTLSFDRPPAGPVTLEATDRAGNKTTTSVVVPVAYPGLRAVHVSGVGWASPQLRDPILRMLDEGRIDAIALDIKDENGVVGFDTEVARAHEIGAVTPHYDLEQVVETVEQHGGRVVGRIAAFRDPILVDAAWAAGQHDQVIQSVDGGIYDLFGRFSNPASAPVRRYNLDLAIDAVNHGVTDILWDDVRLPTGEPDTIVVPGLTSSPSDVITGFLAEAHSEMRRRGAFQGVTTVGIAADTGDPIGQDVARMARNTDYISPQIYPGYWSAGATACPTRPASPASSPPLLTRYQQVTAGTGSSSRRGCRTSSCRGQPTATPRCGR